MIVENTSTQENTTIKALVYGLSGTGKTTSAGTLQGKTLIISCESGLMPLMGKSIDVLDISRSAPDKEGKRTVLTDPAARIARLSEIFKWIHEGALDKSGKPSGYVNVFVDSLTEISELLIQKLNKEFPDRKDSFPMWGEYSKIMRSIVKNFRDLPVNVFMTVLAKPDKDDVGKRYMGFDVSGSIGDKLPQYFDLVLYIHVDSERKRTFITGSTDTLMCKDRSNKLLPQEPVDLGVIASKILIKQEKETK